MSQMLSLWNYILVLHEVYACFMSTVFFKIFLEIFCLEFIYKCFVNSDELAVA